MYQQLQQVISTLCTIAYMSLVAFMQFIHIGAKLRMSMLVGMPLNDSSAASASTLKLVVAVAIAKLLAAWLKCVLLQNQTASHGDAINAREMEVVVGRKCRAC